VARQKDALVWFLWEGTDQRNQKAKGELAARTELVARAELRRQGIRLSKIRKKPRELYASAAKNHAQGDCPVQPAAGNHAVGRGAVGAGV
jgi:type IV pilus assembly protein PilC